MKKTFREFYPFNDEYFTKLWDEAIVVPDANILLNLYYYSRKTSRDLISILRKFKKRIWIPYQVALEYQLSNGLNTNLKTGPKNGVRSIEKNRYSI